MSPLKTRFRLLSVAMLILFSGIATQSARADGQPATIRIISLVHMFTSGSTGVEFDADGAKLAVLGVNGASPSLVSLPATGHETKFTVGGKEVPGVTLEAGSSYLFFVGGDEMPLIVINETQEQAKLGALDLTKFVPIVIVNQNQAGEKPFVFSVTLNNKPLAQKIPVNEYVYFYAPVGATKIGLQLQEVNSAAKPQTLTLTKLYPRTQMIKVLDCPHACGPQASIALGSAYDWLAAQTDPLLSFKTFVKAAKSVKLDEYKPAQGFYTLFVPTDKAFKAFSDFSKISSDPAKLENLLKYHLVDGTISVDDLQGQFLSDPTEIVLKMANAGELKITPDVDKSGGGTSIKDIKVNGKVSLLGRYFRGELVSIQVADGTTINILDTVLTPPAS